MTSWQDKLVAAWYRGSPWLWLLAPLSLFFRLVILLRRKAYQYGLFTSWRAPVPVVVVGNITLGGTGKTPIIIALVEHLQAQGYKVAVISRGYGATVGPWPHVVGPQSSPEHCGDEPLLIYQRTGCCCVAGPDRREDIEAALAHIVGDSEVDSPVDIVLCDDGLQHYKLARDYEIAVLDARRGTGNGWCLPAGPLREPPSRLNTVDAVLYRGDSHASQGVQYHYHHLVNLQTGESRDIDTLPRDVVAMAGIGQPQQFFDTLAELGFTVTPRTFPDHHHYTQADLNVAGDKPIIMTEKDAVKCRAFARESMWYLPVTATLPPAVMAAVIGLVHKESA